MPPGPADSLKRGSSRGLSPGMPSLRALTLLAAIAVPACAEAPDETLSTSEQGLFCSGPNCGGGNSPVIAGVYFWSLHSFGLANPEGVRITGVKSPSGQSMTLRVVDHDRLEGTIWGSGQKVAYTSLIGTSIEIETNDTYGTIWLTWAAPSESFWVGAQSPIDAYTFYYSPEEGSEVPQPLCSEGDEDPNMVHAVVFAGDLYDPLTKAITTGPETKHWFNIACVDSAPYKMHKIGHTTAAENVLGIDTTPDQRRAMLNAWTANVCGTGEAFTHQGEPITLRESLNLLPPTSDYLDPTETVEAIWGPNGAVCLDTPRLSDENPNIKRIITNARGCNGVPKPSCKSFLSHWQDFGHVLTGNPVGE